MKCPIDETELTMTDRSGIEIDYCPKCRGVWLDRGELDKIIERTEGAQPQMPEAARQQPYMQPPQQPYPPRQYDNHGGDYHKKRRKEGLLGELFDF